MHLFELLFWPAFTNSTSRVLVGVGAGLGLCVGPIFLSEIAPTRIQGAVGTKVDEV